MPTLAEKIKFATTYVTNKEGHKFSLKGRDWVRDEFWLPADGFKLWRHEGKTVCDKCADHIAEIVEHPDDNPTIGCQCGGLVAEPIIVTVLNLQRQDGKTFSSMAYALATLFKTKRKSFAFLAASEAQALALYRENYEQTIDANPALSARCDLQRMRFTVPKTHGVFEALSTAHKSATGRSRTHILIDEARDIEARVAMALIPSVFAMHGIECPRGHVQLDAEESINAPKKCTACGERLTPWFGRIIITSSAGVLEDNERDWLNELVEDLEQNPHPNFHVFRADRQLNPRKSAKIVGALEDVFGRLDSTRHYVAAEMGNRWVRKGDDVVTNADVKRVVDNTLTNENHCSAVCVGFLDTSVAVEKTALVILADDAQYSGDTWEHVYVPRLDFWLPGKMPGGVIDELEVRAHIEMILPMFPNLRSLYVDTRGMPWAVKMVKFLRAKGGELGRKLRPWIKTGDESRSGWVILEQRIRGQTIRLPNVKEIFDEFKGVKRKRVANRQPEVVDRDRRKSHKDITEALACCCFLAAQDAMIKKLGMADMRQRNSASNMTKRLKSPVSQKFGPNSY